MNCYKELVHDGRVSCHLRVQAKEVFFIVFIIPLLFHASLLPSLQSHILIAKGYSFVDCCQLRV